MDFLAYLRYLWKRLASWHGWANPVSTLTGILFVRRRFDRSKDRRHILLVVMALQVLLTATILVAEVANIISSYFLGVCVLGQLASISAVFSAVVTASTCAISTATKGNAA